MYFLITNKKKIFYLLEEKQYIYIYTPIPQNFLTGIRLKFLTAAWKISK